MTTQIRQHVIEQLWHNYSTATTQVKQIEDTLRSKKIGLPTLDHLAIIDLPGTHSGIPVLEKILTTIGYVPQGKDYLPEKQNDFSWLAAANSNGSPAKDTLPQVVIADFRLDEMPNNISDIIQKYSNEASHSPIKEIEKCLLQEDATQTAACVNLITSYLAGRDWPLPTTKEFYAVREFNELLAWVLVFGRRPNHFTYSIHLMPEFASLQHFQTFVETEVGLPLNHDGGKIKGNRSLGIEQGSTAGTPQQIQLQDGVVSLPLGFMEFVWRFPETEHPKKWEDYYTGFIANHANRVIQSLYTHD